MKNAISLWSVLFLSFILWACSSASEQDNRTAQEKARNIIVGIAYDISGSVNKWPTPDSIALQQLAWYVGTRCGIIALGHISDFSYKPLWIYDTLCLDTAMVRGRLSQKAKIARENRRKKAEFEQKIHQFLTDVKQKVLVPRNRPRTDIAGSLSRFAILFQEPNYAGYEKILIILSDGFDTVNKSFSEIPDVKIFLIGWRNQRLAQKIFGTNVMRFESFRGAVKYLTKS